MGKSKKFVFKLRLFEQKGQNLNGLMSFSYMNKIISNANTLHQVLNDYKKLKDQININSVALATFGNYKFLIEGYIPNFEKFWKPKHKLYETEDEYYERMVNTNHVELQKLQAFFYYKFHGRTICDLQGGLDESKQVYVLTDIEYTDTVHEGEDRFYLYNKDTALIFFKEFKSTEEDESSEKIAKIIQKTQQPLFEKIIELIGMFKK